MLTAQFAKIAINGQIAAYILERFSKITHYSHFTIKKKLKIRCHAQIPFYLSIAFSQMIPVVNYINILFLEMAVL